MGEKNIKNKIKTPVYILLYFEIILEVIYYIVNIY